MHHHHHHRCRHSDGEHHAGRRRGPFPGFDPSFKGGHGHGGEHGRSFGGGRGGFPFGRFLGDGDLKLVALSLIADAPRHGYDVIKALEERSGGFYSPSPGVVYPTLTYLEEAGLAEATQAGNRKTYAITEAGRAHLDENRVEAEAILARIAWMGARLSEARRAFEGQDERGRGRGRDRDLADVVPELNAARRALKAALASKLDASADEQRRIAALLLDAAKAIAGVDAVDPDDIDLG